MKPITFGKYLLLDRLNVGGMAEVYLAKAFGVEGFERILAIKRILPNMAEDEEFISMFVDEARISVQLNHANIVQIYELGKHEEQYYIAMEYVAGKDLRQIIDHYRRNDQVIPLPMAAFITSQICEGLDYAHNKKDPGGKPLNLIHRDVSPQNILVSFEGEVKVTDFGIAKAEDRASKTQAGVLKGKFGYMAPEQVRGLGIDHRSDIFSVGILLYEMVTGQRLFIGESDFSTLERVRNADVTPPTQLNPDIPEPLERIMLKALAKERDERYQNASDLAEDLQQFLIVESSIFTTKRLSSTLKEMYADTIAQVQQKMEEYMQVRPPPGMAEAAADGAIAGGGGAGGDGAAPPAAGGNEDEGERTVVFESGYEQKASEPASDAKKPGKTGATSAPKNKPKTKTGVSRKSKVSRPQSSYDKERSRSGSNSGVRRPESQTKIRRRKQKRKQAAVLGGVAGLGLIVLALVFVLTSGGGGVGTIIVKSTPTQDVELYLDKKLVATETPLVKTDVPAGQHILMAKAEGYKDKAYRFEIADGAEAEIPVKLEVDPAQQKGTLHVETKPSGARVYLAGKPQGTTPLTLKELDRSQPLSLTVQREGYKKANLTVRFGKKEQEKTVTQRLQRHSAKMVITSKPPEAEVYVNSEGKGITPLEVDGLDPSASYELELKKSGYETHTETVEMEGRAELIKEINLQRERRRQAAATRRRARPKPTCYGSGSKLSVATPGEGDCKVTVGPKSLGVAPFFQKTAPVGRCRIVIKCPSGKSYKVGKKLADGASAKVIVKPNMWK